MPQTDLSRLITEFTVQVVSLVEESTTARIKAALAGVFAPARRGPGRPPKNPLLAAAPVARAPGKKRPKQLCPVPGCKNPAAPVFGMVCAKHKDVPKAKIKEYRAKRKAAKAA
jgi:hypothetical protein